MFLVLEVNPRFEEFAEGFLEDIVSRWLIATDLINVKPEGTGVTLIEFLPDFLPIFFHMQRTVLVCFSVFLLERDTQGVNNAAQHEHSA
jgi:hypothetical protein